MKYVVLLIMILGWWFFIILGMNFLLLDDVLQTNAAVTGSENFSALSTSALNFSTNTALGSGSVKSLWTGLKFLFGFELPDNVFNVPDLIRNTLSFINWIILLLTIITILKVANIIHSG